MLKTLMEIMTKIGKLLHEATVFDVAAIITYLIFESLLAILVLGVFAGLELIPFDLTNIKVIGFGLLLMIFDIMVPEPGNGYEIFKRFFVLKLMAKHFKKKHFDINSNAPEMAHYYQRLADEVLTKYYDCNKEENKLRLKSCMVHKMREDNLPEEKRKAVCQELDLLKVDETISKFEAIFEEYKKEYKKMNK